MSKGALLDVNILVALFDPDHVHHDLAHDWFADHHTAGWATCAVTQNGCVRVLANPRYGAVHVRPAELIDRLRTFCASKHHQFWRDAVSLTNTRMFDLQFIRGHRQVTDIYLLGLAVKMGGHLATFDRSVPLAAVRGATRDSLQIVEPDE